MFVGAIWAITWRERGEKGRNQRKIRINPPHFGHLSVAAQFMRCPQSRHFLEVTLRLRDGGIKVGLSVHHFNLHAEGVAGEQG